MTTAHTGNYRPGRSAAIRYLVLHYTAGRNDSAQSNLRYFEQNVVKASAHYFVDDLGWMQSVDDGDTAWSVGTAGIYVQKHPECRNENSISIELCCRYAAGQYAFSKKNRPERRTADEDAYDEVRHSDRERAPPLRRGQQALPRAVGRR